MTDTEERPKFTAGPWMFEGLEAFDRARIFIKTEGRVLIAEALWDESDKGMSGAIVERNAQLISAAPLMYEALRKVALLRRQPGGPHGSYAVSIDDVIDAANAALRAAEGS